MQEVTLSTGVVLQLRAPSSWAFVEAQRQIDKMRPKPPTHFNEVKGREEPNEADPEYIVALGQWERDLIERLYEVGVVTGTSIADEGDLPIPGPESEELEGLLETLRIEMSRSQKGRYLQWLKYMAAPTTEDMTKIIIPLLRMSGTLEADVALATESFRGGERGRSNNGPGSTGLSEERDTVWSGPAGDGANVRGA